MDIIYAMQREMLRRGYSPRTISTYVQCIKGFMKFCKKELRSVTKVDIKMYLDKYVDMQCAGNTINVNLNALKFLMGEILGKRVMLKIRYSKVPKTAPVFLTRNEVKDLFEATKNEKHRLILELLYSTGLRVSEVVNLKKCNFEFERMIGWVRKGKCMKDRPFIIARVLEHKINKYIEKNCPFPNSYLFIGYKGRKLNVRSVQEIVKNSAKKAKISKNIHPHSLRHSYATHLIEDGYDVATVQPLLGHNSAETTLRYVHMANPKMIKVRSPLDNL